MSYLARLKADVSGKRLSSEPTKPTKAPSVSFVSAPNKHISEIESATDPEAEARRARLLAMLDAHPDARYAVLTDMHADTKAVVVALAIRGQATCELRIPREKWDGVLFLELLDRHSGAVH